MQTHSAGRPLPAEVCKHQNFFGATEGAKNRREKEKKKKLGLGR